MARKTVERGISYDDARKCYYVCMDYGKEETGARLKKYKTFPTLTAPGVPCGISTPSWTAGRGLRPGP